MLVYREAAERFTTAELLRSVQSAFRRLNAAPTGTDAAVAALVEAGELECALTDAASQGAPPAARLTDAAGACLTGSSGLEAVAEGLALLARLDLPTQLTIRPLEGFAYYGLHPTQYAGMACELLRQRPQCRRAAVVGIRSIGAPLSAVVAAALRKEGIAAERITLRPAGHPSNRELQLDDEQARWIGSQRGIGAEFLVVDEGPGRSGSSFLSTAEALVHAGVEAERVSLLCSYEPDVASLSAPDAANRWRRFRCLWPAQNSRPVPVDAAQDLSGGAWRRFFYGDADAWPSSWSSTERLKFLSGDCASILKFEGLGRYGDSVFQRSSLVAEAGFGPSCARDRAGFMRYAHIAGSTATCDVDRETIFRLADYCAFRQQAFATTTAHVVEVERMAAFNLQQILGSAIDVSLPVVHPVIADGRMMPHEWVRTSSGVLLKTDGASHGDDHFYPGPTDIAWDLAGAIVEWRMPPIAAAEFLTRYAAVTRDDASARIRQYMAAYLAFRVGFLQMAFGSCEHTERTRLLRDLQTYRAILGQIIPHPLAQSA